MTKMDAARSELEALGVSVSDLICRDDPLPDSYIVLAPIDNRPTWYAGDDTGPDMISLRATWYCREGTAGLKDKLRAAFRKAGFALGPTNYGYDNETRLFSVYQEAEAIESEE